MTADAHFDTPSLDDLFRFAAERAPIRLAYLDDQFRFVWVNGAFAESLKPFTDSPIGMSAVGMVTGSDTEVLNSVLQSGEEVTVRDREFAIPGRDPSYQDVVIVPVKRGDGKVIGMFITMVDATGRKKAELQLQAVEKQWRDAFDSIPDYISLHDSDYRIIRVNRALLGALGLQTEEVVGKACYEIFHDDTAPRMLCPLSSAKESHMIERQAFYEPKLGIYLGVTVSPLFDESGEVIGFLHVANNISPRIDAEKALTQSEKRYRTLIESMNEGLWMIDKDAVTTFVNRYLAAMLGYEPEEMIGKHISDFVDEKTAGVTAEVLKRRSTRGRRIYRFAFKTRHGGTVYTRLSTSSIFDDDGEFQGALAAIQDITELKLAQDRLREMYKSERSLREKLQQEINNRIDFTRALVHELKTPLTPIMNSSEMLVEILKDGLPLRMAKNVLVGANELNNRVDELLDLARLEIGSLKLSPSIVDVPSLVEETAAMMRPTAERNLQTIDTSVAPQLPSLSADAGRIRQVLLNLVTNAIKYSPRESRIVIVARRRGDDVIMEVQDNGPGVAPEMQASLFNPYVQVQSGGRNLRGLGLGLAIAKNIVELHGGRIWFESAQGKGTSVGFSLPSVAQTERSVEDGEGL